VISDYSGFVKNGFAARSENQIYYGTMEADIIKELCLQQFDSADDEFSTLVTRLELLLVLVSGRNNYDLTHRNLCHNVPRDH